ncbi:MAG: DNA polymerase II [Gammaproteobacteria bacterium]|nr:DNA polymerase II [Gammaproteobacteria bacterium]
MTPAFLLTRQWFDEADGVRLHFWLSSARGPVEVSIRRQSVLFFIRRRDRDAAAALLPRDGIEIRPLDLETFAGEPVDGVYFRAQQQLYRARDRLAQNGIACYEADIRPTERFLCERFITASIDIDSDQADEVLVDVRLAPGDYRPRFEFMSFDIESDFESDELFSIAWVTGSEERVLMIGDGPASATVEYVADERVLIERWLTEVERVDPDILTGWNVINFDLRLLQKRCQALGLPFTVGRGRSLPVWRQSQADRNQHFVLIPGRVVLDGVDTLRSATYNFPSFALDAVAQELLGRGKLIHDNTDPLYKAREIRRQFRDDKAALAAYNLEDCRLVRDVFAHADLVAFSIERARLTGLEMDRPGGSVAAFDNLYLPRLHRKGYVAPNIGDYEGDLSAPGGYVMDSKPGLHDSVLVLDYKSLYPSIIRSFRVDPYARIAARNAPDTDVIPGYDGASFHKHEHILPQIIEHLWQARDAAKRDGNAALSQAIKIIMNSFYGVLGTAGCRLHDSRLTSSITKRGHDLIRQTVKLIEAAGYEVIYGDTDSVFVTLQRAHDNTAAAAIGNRLAADINRYWREHLATEYGIESFLEMEFETHFHPFFMPTMRGSEQGSKKRYAGVIDDDRGNRRIVYKGLETVRTDWTELARRFQQELYRRVFDGEEYADYIRDTVAALGRGEYDDLLVYRKRLHKRLNEYQKNVPPHAQAAIKAEAAFRARGEPARYRNRSWVEYVVTVAGAQTRECQDAKLDYEHYVDKQLVPIADTILNAIGSSMDAVTRQQQDLF